MLQKLFEYLFGCCSKAFLELFRTLNLFYGIFIKPKIKFVQILYVFSIKVEVQRELSCVAIHIIPRQKELYAGLSESLTSWFKAI